MTTPVMMHRADPRFDRIALPIIEAGRQFVIDEGGYRQFTAVALNGLATIPFDEFAVRLQLPPSTPPTTGLEIWASDAAVRREGDEVVIRVPVFVTPPSPKPGLIIAHTFFVSCDDRGIITLPARPEMVRVLGVDATINEEATRVALLLVRCILGMWYVLDHRDVRIIAEADPLRPPTRQQRRAAKWVDRDRYVIRISPTVTIRQIVEDLSAGRSRRGIAPHDRRAHLRRHPKTKARSVHVRSAHVRGGATRLPIYDPNGVVLERDDATPGRS